MPYRAQLGGVFGSGLYPNQRQTGQAGEVIDAVTRGATTLIQGAFARAQKRREQQLQDQELARRDRTEQREVEQQSFTRDMAVRKEARDVEAQQRADATAGYTPSHTEEKETVEPGTVETNGVFGAPGKVSGPSITKQRMTIPGALDYTKSNAYRARAQTQAIKETERGERIDDSETIHRANRKFDVDNPMPSRAGGRGAADASDVHASAAVRAQINEVNGSIKSLEAQKTKLSPTIYNGKPIGGNPDQVAAIDQQLQPLYAKRDSLRTVNERIGGKLTDKAGISRTIGGALGGKKKEAAAAPAKGTITQQEAAALRKQGFTMAQITGKYSIQ